MTAIKYRMGAGFAGDVNRTHPASIEAAKIDTTNPPLGYGYAVVVNPASQGVRQMAAGDTALTNIYGIVVRSYPVQQETTNQQYGGVSFGTVIPPAAGILDVLRSGYIMGPIVGTAVKGNPVYVWVAASSGNHVQGGFEAAATAGSTIPINATFNGGADTNGIGEIAFNI